MIFLGCLFEKQKETEYASRAWGGVSNAANGYQWNLIDGLNAHTDTPVDIINALPVGTWPKRYKQLLLPTREWSYENSRNLELGCLNLPFIKQYVRYRKCLKALRQRNDREIVIYSAYLPFLKAVRKLDKERRVTLVVTDLPEFYDLGKTSVLRRLLRRWNNRRVYRCMERVDRFVILTEQMKEPLRIGDRPYAVVEGICDPRLFDKVLKPTENEETREKIILYTGTLHKQFGVLDLVEAFSGIEDTNYRLWICGGGDSRPEIVAAAERDARIEFMGFQPKEKINELQQRATVLVNPRRNSGEFTKYSFPSKTMEYMLSGKVVVMYKLDGIPDEYDAYLQYAEGDSAIDLRRKLLEVCSWPREKRKAFGEAARAFVSQNKNRETQAKKIIELMND